MCDNYYNIFNALLAGPVKVGETNNNQDQQSAQNNDQTTKEQPQAANPQTPTPQPTGTDTKDANGEQPADNKQ